MEALSNWECRDFIQIPNDTVRDALFEHFGADVDIEQRIGKIMYNYTLDHPERIREVVETREHWRDLHEFHHDMTIKIGGVLKYIETVLIEKQGMPTIFIVRFKDALA